jgi:hypothetical protein
MAMSDDENKKAKAKREHYALYDTERNHYLGLALTPGGSLVFDWLEKGSLLEKCTYISVVSFSGPGSIKELASKIVESFEKEKFPSKENLKDCVLVVAEMDEHLNVVEIHHDTVIRGLFK